MGLVEYDLETQSFTATYDSTRDSTCLAVVAIVSTVLGREPRDLTPLHTVVETDALDELATPSSPGQRACDRISFQYEGFEITVTNEDVVGATPIENT